MIPFPLLLAAVLGGMGAVATEIVYTRRLSLLFGVTASAAATVVAVYLAGMAIGAALGGRVADRAGSRARTLYVAAELGTGAWALLFPLGFAWVDPIVASLPPDQARMAVVAFTALLVGPGAILAGATFPALARVSGSVSSIGPLYAWNAAGAAVGALVAGIWLPDRIGLDATLRLAATLNIVAAVVVAMRRAAPPALVVPEPPATDLPGPAAAVMSLAVLGGVGLLAEIGWTRLLEQAGPNSGALCFPLVLAAYLVGLLLGGTVGAPRLRRGGDRRALGTCMALAGGACAVGVGLLPLIPPESIDGHVVGLGVGNDLVWPAFGIYASADRLGLYLVAAAVPGFASGAGFPIAAAALAGARGVLGRAVGIASATGVLAGVVASLWMGLLPSWSPGVVHILAGAGVVALAAATWLRPSALLFVATPLAGLAFLVPPWAGLQIPAGETVVQFVESASGPSAITEGAISRIYTHGERVNGMALDLAIPMALHPAPRRVLAIAFGTGVNAKAFTRDPDVTDLTVVDIDPVLPALAAHIPAAGPGLFDGERAKFVVDDGRRFLRQEGAPFDIIYSDVATYAQYADLGTVEFFTLVRGRLAPDGFFAVKLHLNTLTEIGVRRFLAAVLAVFPRSYVFVERGPVMVLISSEDPPPVASLAERWERVVDVYGIDLGTRLAERAQLGPFDLARWAEGPAPTDDRHTPWPQMLVGPFMRGKPQATGLPGAFAHARRGEVYPGLNPHVRRVPPPPNGGGEEPVAERIPWKSWLGIRFGLIEPPVERGPHQRRRQRP